MKNTNKWVDAIGRVVEYAVYVYIMYAGLWTICYLVSEILEKMGGGMRWRQSA